MSKEAFIVDNCLRGRAAEAPAGHLFVAALHAASNDMRLIPVGPETPDISCSAAGRYQPLRYKDRTGEGVIEVTPLVVGDRLVLHGANSADPSRRSKLLLRFSDFMRPSSAPDIAGWMLIGASAVNLLGLVNKIKAQFLSRLLATPPDHIPELPGMSSAVLWHVFSFLPGVDLCRAASTCKVVAENANASSVWELLLLRDFGVTKQGGDPKEEYKRRHAEDRQRARRARHRAEEDVPYIPFFGIFPPDPYSPFPHIGPMHPFPESPLAPLPLFPPNPPFNDPVPPSLRPPRGPGFSPFPSGHRPFNFGFPSF